MSSIYGEQNHLSAIFRNFKDSCLASERVQDNTAKLIELDNRRQKLREALRSLKNPRQESTTWLALTESLMMEFTVADSVKVLQQSVEKTEDDYALVNKQVREELNNALRAKSEKDLKARGFDLKPINKAGSLIYDWEAKVDNAEVERICEYPLDIFLEEVDQKAVVVFGEKDGVKLRYYVSGINGFRVSGTKILFNETEQNIFEYLEDPANFPISVRFSPPSVSTNEKIILSSMFHSLYTIAVQLSPAARSTGIEVMETTQFRLSCLQSRTGVKFVVVTSPSSSIPVDSLLNKIYELYADYALKNPFYAIDMPIRCSKFEECIKLLLERVDKNSNFVTINIINVIFTWYLCIGPLTLILFVPMSIDTNFPNRWQIPDLCGYLLFSDGAIIKSGGDLSNRENFMQIVEKIVNTVNSDILPNTKFYHITVSYPEHFYVISQSGKYTYVVKRKVHA
ncbi:Sybindin-like family protein [Dictyocaulus viviparus]|uniref:Trafficking protein particle complex subunit 4 n=1 Tax=Dictyocaulus viviparus TaxID=29172 RepID=A0A0D8Y8M2_DICVI|nr:Sybindin-like family protein [Dictyocaulus viviparus]